MRPTSRGGGGHTSLLTQIPGSQLPSQLSPWLASRRCTGGGRLLLVSAERPTTTRRSERGLVAINSILGWTLTGSLSNDDERQSSYHSFNATVNSFPLDRFWRIDSLGLIDQNETLTADEKYVKKHFETNIKYDTSGKRYEVALTVNPTFHKINLKSNYFSALQQFYSVERSLQRNPTKRDFYVGEVTKVIENGWVEEVDVSKEEVKGLKDLNTYYLPHSLVSRPEAESTPHRLVFNGSAKNGEKCP